MATLTQKTELEIALNRITDTLGVSQDNLQDINDLVVTIIRSSNDRDITIRKIASNTIESLIDVDTKILNNMQILSTLMGKINDEVNEIFEKLKIQLVKLQLFSLINLEKVLKNKEMNKNISNFIKNINEKLNIVNKINLDKIKNSTTPIQSTTGYISSYDSYKNKYNKYKYKYLESL